MLAGWTLPGIEAERTTRPAGVKFCRKALASHLRRSSILSVQEELVMKLISLVSGGDDAFGCDYVLVNLTSNLAQLACRRVAML